MGSGLKGLVYGASWRASSIKVQCWFMPVGRLAGLHISKQNS